jgi:hypothetical protein
MGMTISLSGVLRRAAEQCKQSRDNKHLEFPLLELLKHLRELREKREQPGIIDEFFAVWSDES